MNNLVEFEINITTIISTIITCVVTWLVAKKSQKICKLTYEIYISQLFTEKKYGYNLSVVHNDIKLENPYILCVDIRNCGNQVIRKPPIKIRVSEDEKIMPGYIEDIPEGYKELWTMEESGKSECKLRIEHINPKQTIKARFYLDNYSGKYPIVSCAMEGLYMKKNDKIIYWDSKIQKFIIDLTWIYRKIAGNKSS